MMYQLIIALCLLTCSLYSAQHKTSPTWRQELDWLEKQHLPADIQAELGVLKTQRCTKKGTTLLHIAAKFNLIVLAQEAILTREVNAVTSFPFLSAYTNEEHMPLDDSYRGICAIPIPLTFSLTPLHIAAHDGHALIVALLLHANANRNLPCSSRGTTAFHLACQNGHIEVLALLVQNGADIEELCEEKTPLLRCIYNGRYKAAQWLISNNADVNKKGGKTWSSGRVTPLMATVWFNGVSYREQAEEALALCKALLDRGAHTFASEYVDKSKRIICNALQFVRKAYNPHSNSCARKCKGCQREKECSPECANLNECTALNKILVRVAALLFAHMPNQQTKEIMIAQSTRGTCELLLAAGAPMMPSLYALGHRLAENDSMMRKRYFFLLSKTLYLPGDFKKRLKILLLCLKRYQLPADLSRLLLQWIVPSELVTISIDHLRLAIHNQKNIRGLDKDTNRYMKEYFKRVRNNVLTEISSPEFRNAVHQNIAHQISCGLLYSNYPVDSILATNTKRTMQTLKRKVKIG